MGLDQFAYKTKEVIEAKTDFHCVKTIEITYWRKNHPLHKFFWREYELAGGFRPNDFNGDNLLITKEILDKLEYELDYEKYSFNLSDNANLEIKSNKKFIKKARTAINNGFNVFYNGDY